MYIYNYLLLIHNNNDLFVITYYLFITFIIYYLFIIIVMYWFSSYWIESSVNYCILNYRRVAVGAAILAGVAGQQRGGHVVLPLSLRIGQSRWTVAVEAHPRRSAQQYHSPGQTRQSADAPQSKYSFFFLKHTLVLGKYSSNLFLIQF